MKTFIINGKFRLFAETQQIAENLAEIYYRDVKSVVEL